MSSVAMFATGEHFTADRTGCKYATKLLCTLYIDGELQGSSQDFGNNLEIVAFDQNGIIRGALRPSWNPSWNAMGYLIQCWGYEGLQFTFQVWSHEIEDFLPIEFQNYTLNGEAHPYLEWDGNSTVGSLTVMAHLNFTSSYTLDIAGYGGGTGNWYLIASPVTVAPANVAGVPQGMTQGNFDLYYFDNSKEDEWINYKNEDGSVNTNFGNITPGKGYLYAREEDAVLQFSGEPYSGNGTFGLAYTENNQNMGGWNLMGNPYNYNVSVDKEHFYVMNEDGDNIIVAPDNTPILPMQGFFVLATRTGETVTFEEWEAPFVPLDEVVMNLSRNRGTIIDRAIVHLEGNSTLPKFMLNPNSTKIYIEQGGDDYAVVSSNEDEIPVSFKAASNGTYTLNVAVQNAELDYLHLVDNLAGTDTDLLANPNYTFEANTGDYASRFTLVLRNTTGLVEHFAFYNGHNWTISNDGEALIQVVDVMGRVLNSKEICGNAEINISQPAGVYMFRLVNGSDVKVQKVIVR